MTRQLFACCLALGLVLTAGLASAQPRAQPPAQTESISVGSFSFPRTLAGFTRGAFRDFETQTPGLGQSISYASPGRTTISIFVYDKGLVILDSDAASFARSERDQAVRDVEAAARQGAYQSAEVVDTDDVTVAGADPIAGARLRLVTKGGETVASFVAVRVTRGRIVKVRSTGLDRPGTRVDTLRFVEELNRLVDARTP